MSKYDDETGLPSAETRAFRERYFLQQAESHPFCLPITGTKSMPWLDDEQFPDCSNEPTILPSSRRQWREAFVAIAIGLLGGVVMFAGAMYLYSLGGP